MTYQKTFPQVRTSALGAIRTPNLLIRSQMLYPLSYERRLARSLYRTRFRHRPGFGAVGATTPRQHNGRPRWGRPFRAAEREGFEPSDP